MVRFSQVVYISVLKHVEIFINLGSKIMTRGKGIFWSSCSSWMIRFTLLRPAHQLFHSLQAKVRILVIGYRQLVFHYTSYSLLALFFLIPWCSAHADHEKWKRNYSIIKTKQACIWKVNNLRVKVTNINKIASIILCQVKKDNNMFESWNSQKCMPDCWYAKQF